MTDAVSMGVLASKYWTSKRLTWALAGTLAAAILVAGFGLQLSSSTTVRHPIVVATPKVSAHPVKTPSKAPVVTHKPPVVHPGTSAVAPRPQSVQRSSATVTPKPTHVAPRPTSTPTRTPAPAPSPTPNCVRIVVASVCS